MKIPLLGMVTQSIADNPGKRIHAVLFLRLSNAQSYDRMIKAGGRSEITRNIQKVERDFHMQVRDG
jgi:hypothetical protein